MSKQKLKCNLCNTEITDINQQLYGHLIDAKTKKSIVIRICRNCIERKLKL